LAKLSLQEALSKAINQWRLHIEDNEQLDIGDIDNEEAVIWRRCNMALERSLLRKAESAETSVSGPRCPWCNKWLEVTLTQSP